MFERLHPRRWAIFVVTAGEGIREKSEERKIGGEFVRAHGVQALAIESAEACAEWLHRRIREDWGFPDSESMTMQDRFTSRYRGKPACPNLDDQLGIWKLLQPGDVGVELTEGMMMDPEASVSGLVFHHPDCAYFSAGEADRSAEKSLPGHYRLLEYPTSPSRLDALSPSVKIVRRLTRQVFGRL